MVSRSIKLIYFLFNVMSFAIGTFPVVVHVVTRLI